MLVALILSTGLQLAPDTAVTPERCVQTLRTLDARVNRSARIDWDHIELVHTITTIKGHIRRHGAWPPLTDAPRNDPAPEQIESAPPVAPDPDIAALSAHLDLCLARFPIDHQAD